MSRSILLPLLALGGIILYGTTKAARPATDFMPPDDGPTRTEMIDPAPTLRATPSIPPPAPGLRSEEEPDEPELTPADSTATVPVTDVPELDAPDVLPDGTAGS